MVFALCSQALDPFAQARQAVLAAVNQARQEAGLAPLAPDPRLERLGDAFCAALLAQNRRGHVAEDGAKPYLRYLLAGGRGFHRENVGSYSTNALLLPSQAPALALELTKTMLEEKPPQDGHRRTLLAPFATHLGVGLAMGPHRLVLTHEVATQLVELAQPSVLCPPASPLVLSGRVSAPWRLAAVEVLWEPLPGGSPPEVPPEAASYSYPPRKAWYEAKEFFPGTRILLPGTIDLGRNGAFTWRYRVGTLPGVEVYVFWGGRPGERELEPLALGGCVVAPALPPALSQWSNLAGEARPWAR